MKTFNRSLIFFLLLTMNGLKLSAINPIVPTGHYMADPAGHQWKDGRFYVYGSRDESKGYYCSRNYDVLSTEDLINWTFHKDCFSTVAPKDEVSYFDDYLYAPDCMYKNGKYYLYYCTSGSGEVEGVAVSDKPEGPFHNGQLMKGPTQIDPAVFLDDDGQAYYLWGQFSAKIARLKPNMMEIDPSTIKDGVVTEAKHFFHEGSQMVKRNGIYYFVYAHIGRHGMATSIGYSYSKSPMGPFKYGGVIVDNFGCDPNVWNNHGSVAEFNGKWYVFYHRATQGVVTMRQACVEPITFNEDGTINEVEMTTQGASAPLNPFEQLEAYRSCYLTGKVRMDCRPDGSQYLNRIENLNTAAYKYFNFKKQPKSYTVKVVPQKGGKIIVYANNLCLPVLAVIDVPQGDGKTAQEITVPVTDRISGVHPVYIRFQGEEDEDLFQLDWFRFNE